jgi:hypothetical protein
MYKTLGIKWLHEAFCPALAFVSADSDEARNPQRFIHVTVVFHAKRDRTTNANAHLAHLQAQTHMLTLQLAKEPNFSRRSS